MLGLAMLVTAVPAVRRRDAERLGSLFVLALLTGGVACGQVAAIGARRALETSRDVARAVDGVRAPGDVVVAYGKVMPGLFFYTADRLIQVDRDGAYGELQLGVASAPNAREFFWSGKRRLAQLWSSGQHVFVVTANDCEDELDGFLVPHPRVLARDGYRSVLVNWMAPDPSVAGRLRRRIGGAGEHALQRMGVRLQRSGWGE
jgi:hypothetical protein